MVAEHGALQLGYGVVRVALLQGVWCDNWGYDGISLVPLNHEVRDSQRSSDLQKIVSPIIK